MLGGRGIRRFAKARVSIGDMVEGIIRGCRKWSRGRSEGGRRIGGKEGSPVGVHFWV